MQNEAEGDHVAVGADPAREAEHQRFRKAFRELRAELQCLEPEFETLPAPRTDMVRSGPRTGGPPVNIVLHEHEAPQTYGSRQPLVPRGAWAAGKVALFVGIMVGAHYGPPYYSCRQMRDQGLFYFGTTVKSCMQERLGQRSNPLETIQKSILPAFL